MQCRQRIVEQRLALDLELAAAVAVRLKTDFPADYGRFVEATGVNLNEFLAAGEPDGACPTGPAPGGSAAGVQAAHRTAMAAADAGGSPSLGGGRAGPRQAGATPGPGLAVLARLDRVPGGGRSADPGPARAVRAGGPVRHAGDAGDARTSRPTRPATTTERDWLFQADGQPTAERIRQEIAWTRQLAARLEANSRGAVRFAEPLAELDGLEKQAAALTAPSPELYFRVRQLKRGIMFRNPVVDFQKILLVDMPYPQGSEWPHETRHRLGYMAVPGGRLLILDGLSPAGKLTQLMPQPPLHGSFWRPDLSFDAQKVVVLLQAAQRESLPPVRDQRRRHRAGAADRRHLRRLRSDLPARRPAHPVLHDAGPHLRPLHAADERLRPGPLRPRRQERLPDLGEQRAGLPALGDERRPGDLHPLGIHRQAAVAGPEAVDDQPRRHPGAALLGQPERLARPDEGRPQHPRQPPRDVHRQRPPQLVQRLGGHHRSGRRLQLPRRHHEDHRRRRLGPRSATARSIRSSAPTITAAATTRRTTRRIRWASRTSWCRPSGTASSCCT